MYRLVTPTTTILLVTGGSSGGSGDEKWRSGYRRAGRFPRRAQSQQPVHQLAHVLGEPAWFRADPRGDLGIAGRPVGGGRSPQLGKQSLVRAQARRGGGQDGVG